MSIEVGDRVQVINPDVIREIIEEHPVLNAPITGEVVEVEDALLLLYTPIPVRKLVIKSDAGFIICSSLNEEWVRLIC